MAADIFETPAETIDMTNEYVDVSGVIQTTEVRDVFKVSLENRPSLSVIAKPTNDNGSIELGLYDANGSAVARIEDLSGDGINYFDGLASGDYFVVITSDGSADIDYAMTVSTFPPMVTTGVRDYIVEPREDDVDAIGPDATSLDLANGFADMGGTLDREGDIDVYRFTVGENDYLYASGWLLSGEQGLQIGLFLADGTEVTEGVRSKESGWSNFEGLAAGEYFLVVTANNTDVQDYWITVSSGDVFVDPGPTVTPREDDVEEIGPGATELDMTNGYVQMGGTLDRPGDVDVYRFTVGEYDIVSGGGWRVDGSDGLSVKFFNADGSEVTGTTKDSGSWSSFENLPAGEYFVVVSGDNTESVDYWLNVSAFNQLEPVFPEVAPRPDDANEIGDDATVLDFSSGFAWTDGKIESVGDTDVFTFDVNGTPEIFISGQAYRVDPTGFAVKLFDAEGTEIASTTDPATGTGFLTFSGLADGKYYIAVSDSATEAVGYALNVSVSDPIHFNGGGGDPIILIPESGGPIVNDGNGGLDNGTPKEPAVEITMHNVARPTDVDGDNISTPRDVLMIINWLNANGMTNVAAAKTQMAASGESAAEKKYLDINDDGTINPTDVLLAINELNKQQMRRREAELEGEGPASADQMAVNVDWIFSRNDRDSDLLTAF